MFESLKNLLKHFTGSKKETAVENLDTHHQKTNTTMQPVTESFSNQYITLSKFNLGLGSIGPDNRNDVDPKTVNEMYQAIAAGLFNIPVSGTVPEICVDGRTKKDGTRFSAPSAAGGTLSIVYGADLGGHLPGTNINEIQFTTQTIDTLKGRGHSIGVHGDDHSSCGCGACAKASSIYQHISERIDDITALVRQLGINLTESEKNSIVQRANKRLNQPGFFADERAAVLQAAQNTGALYEELVGKHNELGIALNTKPGTTIDRSAIRAKYGPQYDMFVVDAWTFGNAAKDINTIGNEEVTQRIAKAITLQNVATASVLGHGSLRIVPIA